MARIAIIGYRNFSRMVLVRADPSARARFRRTAGPLLPQTPGYENAPEALEWVRESKPGDIRTIGEQSPPESVKIVERLYQQGAERVWVVDIEIYPNEGQSTNSLVIELPTDPILRRKLFLLEARTAASGGFDPVSDDGQHYMFLYKFKFPFRL